MLGKYDDDIYCEKLSKMLRMNLIQSGFKQQLNVQQNDDQTFQPNDKIHKQFLHVVNPFDIYKQFALRVEWHFNKTNIKENCITVDIIESNEIEHNSWNNYGAWWCKPIHIDKIHTFNLLWKRVCDALNTQNEIAMHQIYKTNQEQNSMHQVYEPGSWC